MLLAGIQNDAGILELEFVRAWTRRGFFDPNDAGLDGDARAGRAGSSAGTSGKPWHFLPFVPVPEQVPTMKTGAATFPALTSVAESNDVAGRNEVLSLAPRHGNEFLSKAEALLGVGESEREVKLAMARDERLHSYGHTNPNNHATRTGIRSWGQGPKKR